MYVLALEIYDVFIIYDGYEKLKKVVGAPACRRAKVAPPLFKIHDV